MVAGLHQLVKARLLQAKILQEHGLLIVVQLGNLLLDLGADDEYLAAVLRSVFPDGLHARIGSAVVGQIILSHIRRIDHRLRGQQIQGGENGFLILIRRLESRGQRSCLQKLLHALQKIRLLRQRLIHSGLLAYLGDPSFQNLNIGENQLQIDRLDIPERIDTAVHMHHVGVFKAAHHMDNRVHLTDVAQKLVAEPLSLRGSLHQSCDVHKLDHGGRHLFGVIHISQKLQPLVRNGHDSHIRVDGAERIVCRFRSRFGQ